MEMHKLEVYVIDRGEQGADVFKELITNDERIHGRVTAVETVELQSWGPAHPLNQRNATDADFHHHFRLSKKPLSANFLRSCAEGKAKPEDIGDWIDAWHTQGTGCDLPEYLGMSELGYRLFVIGRVTVEKLVAEYEQKLKIL